MTQLIDFNSLHLSKDLKPNRMLASLCRESFPYFVRTFWEQVPGAGKIRWNWHLDVFCDELQEVAERVFKGLPKDYDVVLNVSPGTSKSTVWSILFPCWVWTRMPHARIITASNTDSLVMDLSNKSRAVIRSEKYRELFPEIVLREDQDAKSYFMNTLGGDRRTCTASGKSPTGFHAHFVIIDDLIDPKKVLSEAELFVARHFITDVIPDRVVDKGITPIMLVMQRLGLNDPTDVMLEQSKKEGAYPVRHICLPSELQVGSDGVFLDVGVAPQELAARYIDGLMDPVRLNRRALDAAKARGALHYATQFLQRPYAREGGMFEDGWFRKTVKAAPYDCTRVLYIDRASTEMGGCYTAMVLMARSKDGNFYVEHVTRGQWEPGKRNRMIKAEADRCRARYGPDHAPKIWIESEGGSTGKDANIMLAQVLAGHTFHFEQVTGSKDVRAEPWSSQLEAGNVWMVVDGTWDLEAFITEHVAFKPDVGKRLGKYKDQVDSASGAFRKLQRPGGQAKIHIIPERSRNAQGKLRLVVATYEELANVIIDERSLLIYFTDPPSAGEEPLPEDNAPPLHSLNRLLDSLNISFADIAPEEKQESWGDLIQPWNRPAEELIMKPQEHGKKLWAFITKKRSTMPPECILFVDDGDRRALSSAQAVADILRLVRKDSILRLSEPDSKCEGVSPNDHVYRVVKASRGLVM